MRNKFVENVNPYKPSDRKSFNEVDLYLDWNESDLIWSNLEKKIFPLIKPKSLNRYPDLNNLNTINSLEDYVGEKCSIDLYPGSDNAHEYILRAFKTEAASVFILDPGYSNFRVSAQSLGYDIDTLTLKNEDISDFDFLFSKLLGLKKAPNIFYLINPHSPTGNTFTKNQIEKLLIKYSNSLFIIDEAYVDFSIDLSSASLIKKHPNLIITRSFSKAFSLAGSRIGFSITNKSNSNHLKKIINTKHLTDVSKTIIMHTMENINELKDHVSKIKKNVEKIHNVFKFMNLSELNQFNTNFYFLLFSNKKNRNDLYNFFLKNKILTRKIDSFDKSLCGLRITIPGKDNSFKKLLIASKDYLKK